ncbi:MAG: histidine phosphotransferase ChpT [Maricaulaceae bacterium]
MSTAETKLTAADLSALMCARICHDLVSPIGALATAIEVLDDENNVDMHDDAMSLVKLSAKQASAKLQFLRLAFGAGSSAPGVIGVRELIRLIDGIYGDGKANIVWDAQLSELDKSVARIALNMTMLAVQAVPRGGEVKIQTTETASEVQIRMDATGPKARLNEAVPRTLSGKAPEDGFDGRTIQPFYTGMMVRELSANIQTSIEGECVTFLLTAPKA